MVRTRAKHQVYIIVLLLRMVTRQNLPITVTNIKQKEEVEAHTSRSSLITDYEEGVSV